MIPILKPASYWYHHTDPLERSGENFDHQPYWVKSFHFENPFHFPPEKSPIFAFHVSAQGRLGGLGKYLKRQWDQITKVKGRWKSWEALARWPPSRVGEDGGKSFPNFGRPPRALLLKGDWGLAFVPFRWKRLTEHDSQAGRPDKSCSFAGLSWDFFHFNSFVTS